MLPRTLIGAGSKSYLDLAGARRWPAVVTAAIDSGEPADGLFWCPPMPLVALAAGRSGEFRVLYGGSAGPGTFAALVDAGRGVGRLDEVPDGVFLGRAGLDPDQFLRTVREVRAARA